MNISLRQIDNIHVAALEGVLDEEARGSFDEQLHPLVVERGAGLVIDLSAVPRATSMGLGQLVALVARANTKGARVVLAAASPFVRSVLAVSRLDQFFDSAETVDAARERLR